jgi:hypothetical protein
MAQVISNLNAATTTRFFTPDERQHTLDWLLADLHADERVAGVVIAGSGAFGFRDKLSDIDICVVVLCEDNRVAVYEDWRERVRESFSILHLCETSNPIVRSAFLLLAGFLGVDAFFVSLDNLHARRARWRVAWDRTEKVNEIMLRTWENRKRPDVSDQYVERLDYVWHRIIPCVVAVKRGWLLEALDHLATLRTQATDLAFLSEGVEERHHRQMGQLPAAFLSRLEKSLPRSLDPEEILRALRITMDCFFEPARLLDERLGLESARELEKIMREYLNLVQT